MSKPDCYGWMSLFIQEDCDRCMHQEECYKLSEHDIWSELIVFEHSLDAIDAYIEKKEVG